MTVLRIDSDEEILATREVMLQLRPHLAPDEYLPIVRRMMATDGFRIVAAVDEGTVRAVAGYRFIEMLYCGRILVVDDLITDERSRSRGWGKQLLDWLKEEGRANGCGELHLDSALHREAAHRFYAREGFTTLGHHFRTKL
jgi:GNAT superfamily N-acetyltransferase